MGVNRWNWVRILHIGEIFNNITDGLSSNDGNKLSETLDNLDGYVEDFLTVRAEVGAKTNNLEAMLEQNQRQSIDMSEILSKNEDIDYSQKIMEYTNMETIYKASLSTGARVIQPTLLDFLR